MLQLPQKKKVIEKYKVEEGNVDIRYIASQKNMNHSLAKVFLKEIKKEKKQSGKKQSKNVKKS